MNNQLELQEQAPDARREEGVAPLLSGIVGDLEKLVSQHLELLKTEVKKDLHEAKNGVVNLGFAACMGLLGAGTLLAMVVHLLYLAGLPLWASLGLVGAVTVGTAVVLFLRGKEQIAEATPPVPEQTVDELKEDARWIKKQM
jgi:hypothetical protein